jgi:hypothetical protein
MRRIVPTLVFFVAFVSILFIYVPRAHAQTNPEITLEKTVGTDPNVCATTDEITVEPGTEVTYCFRATNTGDVTLETHTLVDSELGILLSGAQITLEPGESTFVLESTELFETTTNVAVWIASAPYVPPVEDDDTATVIVVPVTAVTLSDFGIGSASSWGPRSAALILAGGLAGAFLWHRRR